MGINSYAIKVGAIRKPSMVFPDSEEMAAMVLLDCSQEPTKFVQHVFEVESGYFSYEKCVGENCSHCANGIKKRTRYILDADLEESETGQMMPVKIFLNFFELAALGKISNDAGMQWFECCSGYEGEFKRKFFAPVEVDK